jgi:hypothetical protein
MKKIRHSLTFLAVSGRVSRRTCLMAAALSRKVASSSTLLEESMVKPYSNTWPMSRQGSWPDTLQLSYPLGEVNNNRKCIGRESNPGPHDANVG